MKKTLLLLSTLLFVMCSEPCEDVSCQNGATCDDGTCICTEDFSGVNCETRECYTCTLEGSETIRICKDDYPGDVLNLLFNTEVAATEAIGYSCE